MPDKNNIYLNIFLYNTLFPSYKKQYISKVSILNNNKLFKNIFVPKMKKIEIDQLSNKKEQELYSLLFSLKLIHKQTRFLQKIKNKYHYNFILKININFNYLPKYNFILLYDTWEYLNFRGTPYKEYWQEIYYYLNELNNIIKIKI